MTDPKEGAERPQPVRTGISEGFWEAVERDELAVQECSDCGLLRHYPQEGCASCGSPDFTWRRVSGRGEIHSYTVTHRAFHPAWAEHVPYVVATIELEEGVRVVCDLLDAPPDAVAIGQRVEAYFETMPGQGRMPRFRIVE